MITPTQRARPAKIRLASAMSSRGAQIVGSNARPLQHRFQHGDHPSAAAIVDDPLGFSLEVPLHPRQGKLLEELAGDKVGGTEGMGVDEDVHARLAIDGQFLLEKVGTFGQKLVAEFGRTAQQKVQPRLMPINIDGKVIEEVR